MNQTKRITYTVYKPNCAANCSDKYLVEVRRNGWLIDRQRKDSNEEAEQYGKNYDGTDPTPAVLPLYVEMIKRHANK